MAGKLKRYTEREYSRHLSGMDSLKKLVRIQIAQIRKLEKENVQLKIDLLLEQAENAEMHCDELHREHPEYLYPTDEEKKWSEKAQQFRAEASKLKGEA